MANKVICVTGGAGYLGSWIVKTLLERGYDVRATVRSINNDSCKHLNKDYLAPGSKATLTLYEADLLVPNSFDDAINGSDVIIHSAAPFLIKSALDNPEEKLIKPATDGTENVFNSINRANSVKHVVFTSSIAAITIAPSKIKIFDEHDWAIDASTYDTPYQLSKRLAEEMAWKAANEQNTWQLTVINPSFIIGPTLSPRVNDGSIDTVKDLLNGKYFLTPKFSMAYVDVRDVAESHVRAFEKAEITSGQRYLCYAEVMYLKELGQLLKEKFGDTHRLPKYSLPKVFFYFFPFLLPFRFNMINKLLGVPYQCSNLKIKHDLDMKFRSLHDSINDMVETLIKFGIVK